MNKLIVLFLLISIHIFAAAPPVDDKPLPPPPYNINNATKLNIVVEWDNDSIKKYLPKEFQKLKLSTGGIELYYSKKRQPFSPASGAYAWVDLTDSKEKVSRLVFFSVYGKSKLLHKVMTKVYSLDSSIGSSKITIINEKVVARTNIKNKNIFNIIANVTENCRAKSGSYSLINYKSENKKNLSTIEYKSNNVCKANLTSTEFNGPVGSFVISKVLDAELMIDLEISHQAPYIIND